jgi:predicted  nucleic acid-binding Zn-ribbon protein
MVQKTRLGEEIEILIDRMESLEVELESLRALNKNLSRTLNFTLILFQSMQDTLIEKGSLTKEEVNSRAEYLKSLYESELHKERKTIEEITESEYQTWLLTSGSYGNA